MPRRSNWLTAIAVLPTALILGLGNPAQAACPEPSITVSPDTAVPGQRVTVRGADWRATCNDQPGAAPSEGAKRIRLSFVQGGRAIELGVVDAANNRTFVAVVRVPPSANRGHALLVARGPDRAEVAIKIIARRRAELPLTGGGVSGLALALVVAVAATTVAVRRITPPPEWN